VSDCNLFFIAEDGSRNRWQCTRCGREFTALVPARRNCALLGPGGHLTKLLAELGAGLKRECGCESKAAQMDSWDVEGCKKNRGTILQWLQEAAAKVGWLDRLKIAARAVCQGKACSLDPISWLVDRSIQLAEAGRRSAL
jgi:hypothetical protein